MATINFGKTVSLKQAAALIVSCPDVRFFVQGEPGIGKSSILSFIKKALQTHNASYIDVSTLDLGDIGYPAMDHDAKVARFYPNARFRITEGKPVAIMLDEFTKGMDPVKNMLHPLLEVNNPRLGDCPLPEGSIVFMTGNLASDGVGDTLKAHSRNRVTTIQVAKPDADMWLEWAMNADIDPVVMAWVKQFPQALASYLDAGQSDNPYIYNPKKVQPSFVSPRSLELASNIVSRRDMFDSEALTAALSGTIGESAARDMQAFIEYQDQLPTWESILKSPTTVAVPTGAGACAVLIYGAVSKVNKETFDTFMQYLVRFEPEWQAVFAVTIAKSDKQAPLAFASKEFKNWLTNNTDII